MPATHYPFAIGTIACTVLLENAAPLGRERLLKRFPDVSAADCERAYAALGLSPDDTDTAMNVLAAQMDEDIVLVDTGEAGKPNGGWLLDSMKQAGIAPQDVTLVVITHTHGDHVLGLLDAEGAPTFPNARYVLSREERAFWEQRISAGTADHRALLTMVEARGLRLIAMDEAILPGLTAVPLPGHTPGQIGLLLESQGAGLLHLADALHTHMQFAHPDWSPTFDTDKTRAAQTRGAALGRAADAGLLALFYHLTFPGLGRVQRAGTGFVWEPLAARLT